MRKNILLVLTTLLLFASNNLLAQKKDFTYEQLFPSGGAPAQTNVTKSLPQIVKWLDDDHYIEARRDDKGSMKQWNVEVKTGKAVEYDGGTMITPKAD